MSDMNVTTEVKIVNLENFNTMLNIVQQENPNGYAGQWMFFQYICMNHEPKDVNLLVTNPLTKPVLFLNVNLAMKFAEEMATFYSYKESQK